MQLVNQHPYSFTNFLARMYVDKLPDVVCKHPISVVQLISCKHCLPVPGSWQNLCLSRAL